MSHYTISGVEGTNLKTFKVGAGPVRGPTACAVAPIILSNRDIVTVSRVARLPNMHTAIAATSFPPKPFSAPNNDALQSSGMTHCIVT